VGIAVVLLVVIVVGGTVGYAEYRLHQIHKVHADKIIVSPASTGGIEDILLIGSTDRCAVTKIKEFVQQCQDGVNGINSDVVMVVRLDPANHRVTLLSIPRDTFVPDARSGGLYNKIDAALYDGPNQLATAITQDFGIPINHFVELNFQTFANVVSALGGIYMDFPARLFDPNSDLTITHTGCQYLNGIEALELVRARHTYYFTKGQTIHFATIRANANNGIFTSSGSGGTYDGSGDLGRITRVHLFIKALASEIQHRGLGNVLTDNSLIGAIAPYLTVDDTLGASEMVHLVLAFHHANFSSAPELTLPIVSDAVTFYYKGYNYGLDVFPSEPQDQKVIDAFMGTTPPGLRLAPSTISVSVVQGDNSATETAAVASALGALGYKIVPTTAADDTGPVSETSVVYAAGHLQEAERVMASLSGTVVMAEGVPAGGAKVSVVTGTDLGVQSASRATTSTATPGSTSAAPTSTTATTTAPTTTPSVTTTTNPDFAPPTSANPSIPFYDPRACATR
jgi:LCP family protein required for cell wall assembly